MAVLDRTSFAALLTGSFGGVLTVLLVVMFTRGVGGVDSSGTPMADAPAVADAAGARDGTGPETDSFEDASSVASPIVVTDAIEQDARTEAKETQAAAAAEAKALAAAEEREARQEQARQREIAEVEARAEEEARQREIAAAEARAREEAEALARAERELVAEEQRVREMQMQAERLRVELEIAQLEADIEVERQRVEQTQRQRIAEERARLLVAQRAAEEQARVEAEKQNGGSSMFGALLGIAGGAIAADQGMSVGDALSLGNNLAKAVDGDEDAMQRLISNEVDSAMADDYAELQELRELQTQLEAADRALAGGDDDLATTAPTSVGYNDYGSTAGGFLVDKQIYVDCPAGRQGPIPIKAKSHDCANAMEAYARSAVCNDIGRMQDAQGRYYSACANEMYEAQ